MTAMHWRSRWGSGLRAGARLACVLAATAVGAAALAEEPVPAVFKAHEVDFMYRSSDVFYPCHELQGSVATILRAVGARDDIEVRVTGCDDFQSMEERFDREGRFDRQDRFDRMDPFNRTDDRFLNRRAKREQMAHIRVRLMMPVKVTPEVLKEIDKDKSRRELISRVTGNPMAAMNDPIVFPAQRQTVTLSRRTIRLEAEHCELLDEMTTGVFRKLDVRVVRGNPNCSSGSRIAPQVTVEALLPAGMTRQAPPPATGQGEPDPAAPAAEPVPEPASESAQPEVSTTP